MGGLNYNITQPNDEVAEVTLIGGPHGYGESVVIHIGNGEWAIVDSCIDPYTKESLPLSYLLKMGVDVKNRLKYIICTHWHKDHIDGISKLLESCSSDAIFALSCAEDRKTMVYEYASNFDYTGRSKVLEELTKTFKIASERKIKVKRVEQDKLIFKKGNVQCFALSPSEFEIRKFEKNIASAMNRFNKVVTEISKREQEPSRIVEEASDIQQDFFDSIQNLLDDAGAEDNVVKESVVELVEFKDANKIEKNDRCVAMLISFGSHHVILGADLEVSCVDSGWHSVISCECMKGIKANLLKIPHHGSKTGYLEDFINQCIEPQATAKLSTWISGSRKLPDTSVLKEYFSHTSNLFITNDKLLKYKNTEKDRSIRKIMNEKTEEIIEIVPLLGIVQSRISLDSKTGEWETVLFGSATRITDKIINSLS